MYSVKDVRSETISVTSRARQRLRELLTREVVGDLVIAAGGFMVALTGVAAGWANLAVRLGIEDRMPLVWVISVGAGILFVALRRFVRSQTIPIGELRVHFLSDLKVFASLFALFLGAIYITKSGDSFSRGWILSWALAAPIGLLGVRLATARLGEVLARRLVVVGLPREVAALRSTFATLPSKELRVVAVFMGEDVQTLADQVATTVEAEPVDEVLLAVPIAEAEMVYRLCDALVAVPADISVWLGDGAARLARLGPFELDPIPRQILLRRPICHWGRIAKGLMDRLGAAVLLVLLSPLFLLIAIAIKLDSPGPVFFRQWRYGYGRKPFVMWKFRSMYTNRCDAPNAQIRQATRNDPRVTRVGRWLRRTSLDELPQLINVLRGEMSLVGPRPHATRHDDELSRTLDLYLARNRVKPGMTGLAQIHGYRGELDTPEKLAGRLHYDLTYVRDWSLALDLWILALTPWCGFIGRNAY